MPGKAKYIALALAALMLAVMGAATLRADVTGRPHDLSLTNPRGHCINCHDLHQTGLGEGFAHNLKRANEIAVCYQCHAGAMNDYSSIDPTMPNKTSLYSDYDIRSEFNQTHIHFPTYGMDGERNKCSYCHNPHGVFNSDSTTRKPKLLSAGPDIVTDTDEYCFVCHNSDASPPHSPFPNISVGSQYRFSRNTYRQMTHSTFERATTITEPVPDTAHTYEDNPYGKGMDISCLTCHRPHGSPNEHMLKLPDDQDLCLYCHDGSKAPSMTRFTTSGHGKAGVDRICQECHFPHGTGQENAVKTSITDPHTGTANAANVNASGMNEACFACHGAITAAAANYSFDAGISGWATGGLTQTAETVAYYTGGGSLKQYRASASSTYSYTGLFPVSPNTQYTFTAYRYIPALSGGSSYVYMYEYTSGGSGIKSTTCLSTSAATSDWQRVTYTITTTATTGQIRIYLYLTGAGTVYWDEVKLVVPASTGYYQGKTTYNAGIHKTSAAAHNPVDTGGDQAAGDCDNCHDPHGRGYGKMLVDARDQTLCYDCHNASTPNTKSGRDVQAAFQMASRHDLTKVACVNCHNVHKATQSQVMMDPYDPSLVMTAKTSFCLSCHSGTMPAGVTGALNAGTEWAGGGHDKTHLLACDDCHVPHGSPNPNNLAYEPKVYGSYTARFAVGMTFASRGFCESCHNRAGLGYKGAKKIPTGGGYVGQHDQADGTSCSTCHKKRHNPTLGNYTGVSSFYTTACLDCHTQGMQNPYPDADIEFNTPANATDANAERSIHNITYSPPTTVDCATCHGSKHETDHGPANKLVDPDPFNGYSEAMPSISTSSVFCLECHDATPVTLGGSTPANILDTYTSAGHGKDGADEVCSACHVHHGSASEKLLKQTINGKAVLGTYSGNNVAVCTACHAATDAAVPMWPGYSVYSGSIHAYGNATTGNLVKDGRHGPGVCVNCHNPHGARQNGVETEAMLYKKGEDLCYTCHSSGFDNFSTAGDYNNRWTRFSNSALSITKTGGALRFGRTSVNAGTALNDGLDYSAAFPDFDCTITVRMKAPEMVRTDGYNSAGLRIYDPVTGTYVQLLYRSHSTPHAWVVRYTNDGGAGTTLDMHGDITTTYHTLKMVRNAAVGTVDTYVDDTLVRNCTMPRASSFKVRLYGAVSGTADATPEVMDAYFDDLKVYYPDDRTTHNTSSGDDVQMRFYMKSRHAISDLDQLGPDGLPGTDDDAKVECVDCHDPHTVTEKKMAYRNVSGMVVPIEADQEFCLKCHDADPPAGVVFPADGVWDKSAYDLSAHGNPLVRNRTFGNYSNGVLYPCKVCHNPHGSDQSHLQRDSWDIDRDGIPDDIDGDGVLDSTMMVGFIGYSSNSRKAILVSEPRPGFQRISSTIPVQANGTVDVELCFNCHDGSPAPDVETDFGKLSHHDVAYADQVASGGSKIECYHCHDQHRAQARDDSAGHYPTTNPDPPREPMPGDAKFCLRCHDNTLPEGVSFGAVQPKNVKLSYNPYGLTDADGYDLLTSYQGHYVQSNGAPLMCRECHNQHGSSYAKLIRDDTESARPNHNPAQDVQEIEPLALRPTEALGGSDTVPLSSTTERCLACHSGRTTYKGNLLPLPPPPDAAERGFSMSPVGKHPDLKPEVTVADEVNGHIYRPTFAVITTPGSVKEECTQCHDSHNPYIHTLDGQLMDCYQCHNENTSLPDVQSEFNDNPTNPSRSQSIHPVKYDPTGTTPAYVECLKCHDQTKHMQGTVRLRKDPTQFVNYTSDSEVWADPVTNRTINQFCLECHDPDSTVAGSFWRGGTEHVPPRLPAGHGDGAHFVNGTLLCTDCHEYHGSVNKGLRKNAKGDQETFCYSCHNSPANSKSGVNVQAKFAGSSHHDVASSDQAAKGTKVECEDCHNPHVVTRANSVVDADDRNTAVPADDAFCIGCHDSDAAAGIKFPGYSTGGSAAEWDSSTGRWNRWDKSAYAGSSHQTGGITCRECHDPHGSPNYSMLLQNISSATGVSVGFGVHSTARGKRKEELGVNSVCAGCHKGAMGVYGGFAGFTSSSFGHKKGIDKNCTYCHNPHGTGQANLMRANRPLYMNATSAGFGSVYNFKGFANATTGAPYYTFCSSVSCHPSERSQFGTFDMDLPVDNFSQNETASSHHPIKEGTIGCTSCHYEHGSANSPDLRAPYFRESGWPELFHSGRGVYSSYHRPGVGDPFDGTDFFEKATSGLPDATHRNTVTTVSPPSNANDLCFMCHQQDDITGTSTGGMTGANTRFLGHEAVKGGAPVSHNIARDVNGVGSDYHNFSCSMCHFPHSSKQGKLLKTSCMSQADGDSPNSTYGTVFQCHPYRSWANWNAGWRNLTTVKTDFRRPPNAVTDLSYTLDADLTVHLDWSAVADQPGQGADHYNVYRSSQSITQATKQYATRIYKGVSGVGTGLPVSWTDYTGQPNTTYYYAVVACDSENNESFVSNCVTAALGADTIVPNAVANQQTAQVAGTYNVKVTWSDPGDNVNVTQYKVYRIAGLAPLSSGDIIEANRRTTATDTSQSSDGSADAVAYSYTDTSPTVGQDFSYAVMAVDAAGLVSPLPTGVTFSVSVVDPAPAAVTTLTAKPVTNQMKASLTWTAPTNVGTISGYNVYRKGGSAVTQADIDQGATYRIGSLVAGLTWTDDAVPAVATDYYYTVTAVDQSSGKESLLGNVQSVNIPSPPGGIAMTALQGSRFRLNWDAPAYATNLSHYKVYARRNGGSWAAVTLADNPVPNAGFESGLSRWSATTVTAAGAFYSGKNCVKLTGVALGDKFIEEDVMVPVKPSVSYTYSGYVNIPQALSSGYTTLRVIEYNSTGGYVTEKLATQLTTTSGWQPLTYTWTTNAGTAQVKLRVQMYGVGTAYWDDLKLAPANIVDRSATADMAGLEPGNYDFAVTANYTTHGGTAPYESITLSTVPATLTDTMAPQSLSVTGALISPSNTQARLSWNSPADQNYGGYSASGVSCFRVESSYDQCATWATILNTRLTNPGFETASGTIDDATTDTFTDWTISNTSAYSVSDALFESKAVRIKYTGSGNGYITAPEPDTGQTVANRQYSMSFWAKANKAKTISFSIQAFGGGYELINSPAMAIGTSWQRYTLTNTFGPGVTATRARAVIWTPTDTTVEVTIDGVRLESGDSATLANDGSYYRPSGYDSPGTALSFDDPKTLTAGTNAYYRLRAFDQADNITGTSYVSPVAAKPTPASDIKVTSSDTKSANVVNFSSTSSMAGVQYYDVYAKEQGSALSSGDLIPANLIGSFAATYASGDNRAGGSTASSSGNINSSYPPSLAVDGLNTDTSSWRGQQVSTPQWLQLDFASPLPLYRVTLYFYSASSSYRPKDYLVQTWDGSAWVTQSTVTGNSAASVTSTFGKVVTTSKVRLYLTQTSGGLPTYYPIVNEMMVYTGETYVHDIQNTTLMAEAGHTYAYAVIATDVNGITSGMSGGSPTVKTVTDKDAPDKVADLAVTSPAGTTQAILNWSTPLDNQGHGTGTGATQYEIYRLPTSVLGTPVAVSDSNYTTATLVYSGPYTSSTPGTFNNYTATWYDHKGVYYAVRSADSAGNWSAISNSPPGVVVGKDQVPPEPPVITDCSSVTTHEVDLYWDAATDDVGINGYRMFRADVDIEPFLTDQCITENNIGVAEVAVSLIPYNWVSASDAGALPGRTYYYALRAWDSENNMSNISNCAIGTVLTEAADATPPAWGATPLAVTAGQYPAIDLVWDPASDLDDSGGAGNIDHYDVYRSLSSFTAKNGPGVTKIATVAGIRGSYVDVTGEPETAYHYGLVAADASASHNESALSNVASATVAVMPSPDNTPPGVPGGLSASTGVYPSLNLAWSASSDLDDASASQPLNYYKLYVSDYPLDITEANKDNPAEVRTILVAHDAESYAARGTGGQRYNFRLEAFDLAGNASGLSAQVNTVVAAAPCADTTAPTAPAGLGANVGPSPDMELFWTASTDQDNCATARLIDHYRLYRAAEITVDTDLGTLTPIYIAGNSATFTDTTGAPNTTYDYVLTAVDSAGNESGMSGIITRSTMADTMPPAAVADLKAAQNGSVIRLTWSRPSDNIGVDHYEVYRKEQGTILTDGDIVPGNMLTEFTNAGLALSYDDAAATSGHTYSYAVIAVDGAGKTSTISRGRVAGDTIATAP